MKHLSSILVASLLSISSAAVASPSFVNGGFEDSTNGPGLLSFGGGNPFAQTNLNGWTASGLSLLLASGTGDDGDYPLFWGPNNYANNGFNGTSPSGGNYVALGSDYNPGPLSQTITGLEIGRKYKVGFDFALAEQYGYPNYYTNDISQVITVSLGNVSQSSGILTIPYHGFSDWSRASYSFTATAQTEVLSFLTERTGALYTSPLTLIDGVTFDAVPEPGTWAMLGLGVAGAGVFQRRRRTVVSR